MLTNPLSAVLVESCVTSLPAAQAIALVPFARALALQRSCKALLRLHL